MERKKLFLSILSATLLLSGVEASATFGESVQDFVRGTVQPVMRDTVKPCAEKLLYACMIGAGSAWGYGQVKGFLTRASLIKKTHVESDIKELRAELTATRNNFSSSFSRLENGLNTRLREVNERLSNLEGDRQHSDQDQEMAELSNRLNGLEVATKENKVWIDRFYDVLGEPEDLAVRLNTMKEAINTRSQSSKKLAGRLDTLNLEPGRRLAVANEVKGLLEESKKRQNRVVVVRKALGVPVLKNEKKQETRAFSSEEFSNIEVLTHEGEWE